LGEDRLIRKKRKKKNECGGEGLYLPQGTWFGEQRYSVPKTTVRERRKGEKIGKKGGIKRNGKN